MELISSKILRHFACVLMAVTLCVGFSPASTAAAAAGKAETASSSDGISIAYEAHGKGSLGVILVHGWSCDRSYWKAQIEPLAKRYRVVTVDLAGHGESGFGRKAWTIESFGDDVAAVAQKLGLRRVVLVGHSMGGDVIMAAAGKLKGRVAGLIWVDDYKDLDEPNTPEQIQAFVAKFRSDFVATTRKFVRGLFLPDTDPALVEHVVLDMSSAPQDVALGSLESSFNNGPKTPAILQELELPVVAINPETPPTNKASLNRYGVEVVLIPGVGHFMMLENPNRFNPELIAAIESFPR